MRTGSDRFRGILVITSGSTGSTPRDWAGGPSMIISIFNVSDDPCTDQRETH